jgi:hypothetical protein
MAEAVLTPDPEMPDRKAAESLRQAARTLMGTLRVAQALVDCNRTVDLTGLDGAVGVLCAQILDLPPNHARALRAELLVLQADLDQLDAVMQRTADP